MQSEVEGVKLAGSQRLEGGWSHHRAICGSGEQLFRSDTRGIVERGERLEKLLRPSAGNADHPGPTRRGWRE